MKQFSEVYGGEIVNINRAIASKAILLDDDEILHEFQCKKIIGLPSGVWSSGKSEWTGKCVVSLIKNKRHGRLRFHFSIAEASIKFDAKETFVSRVFGFALAAFSDSTTAATVKNNLDVSYKQVSAFTGGDCSIPIPLPTEDIHTFGSCYAYRKANKELSVIGKGHHSAFAGSAKVGKKSGKCYIFACAEQIRKNPSFCSCQPVVEKPSSANILTSSEIKYEVTDSFVLGAPQNTWSESSLHPAKVTTAERNPDAPLDWQPMCFGLLQYKGIIINFIQF